MRETPREFIARNERIAKKVSEMIMKIAYKRMEWKYSKEEMEEFICGIDTLK